MSNENKKEAQLLRVYIKDASLEVPNSPEIFAKPQASQPQIDVQMNSQHRAVGGNNQHEVVIKITMTAKVEDETVFIVEVQQAGLFVLQGFSNDEIARIVSTFCPNTIFPFLREAVADLIGKGGFPPVLLSPVNFEALYQKHHQDLAKAEKEAVSQQKH